MIGKAALTKDTGELFIITSVTSDNGQEVSEGFKISPDKRLDSVKETEPRILCDIIDLLDYGKVADETIKLNNREIEAKELTKASLIPKEIEEPEDESL